MPAFFLANKEACWQTHHSNMLDAQARKEEHLKKSIEHLKSRGKEDVSAASAAKSKEKKLARTGENIA